MVPKQPTNQPTDRQTGGTQPTDEQTSAGFGKQQKTQEKVSFQAFTMREQSCSLPCHCKAVRNTLRNTQVSQTSKTRPHARNNWGTWRGHNNQLNLLAESIDTFATLASRRLVPSLHVVEASPLLAAPPLAESGACSSSRAHGRPLPGSERAEQPCAQRSASFASSVRTRRPPCVRASNVACRDQA